jgi:hypothetical protein
MLTNILNTINSLKSFSFQDEQRKIVHENAVILEALQEEQLDEGKDRNDERIKLVENIAFGFGYRDYTIEEKKSKGQPYDRVTWKDTGALHESLQAAVSGDAFKFQSTSFKFDVMLRRSGPDVVGLNLDKRKEFAELVTLPGIRKVLKERTGLIIK